MLGGLGAVGAGALLGGSATANEHDDDQGEGGDGPHEPGPEGVRFPPDHLTEWGEPVDIGDGEGRGFVAFNSADQPLLVGIEFDADALDGLGDDHDHFHLEFPDRIDDTPFEWAGLDWGPEGHGPPGVYSVPHFDVHFYLLEKSEVEAIPPVNFPPGQTDEEPYTEPIAEDQFPPNYVRDHSVVPAMGEHLADITAPEWSGAEFTKTFIWGHYDSDLIFFEPMVTVDYLENVASGEGHPFQQHQETTRISMPERLPEAGRYPTEYTVRYHDDEDAYTITLELFRQFEESEGVEGGE